MKSLISIPSPKHFAELVRCFIPSSLRHDLISPLALDTDKISGQRRDDRIVAKIGRMITALSEGHPIVFGRYPDGVYQQLLLFTLSGVGIGKEDRGRGVIALASRYNKQVPESHIGFPEVQLVFFPAPVDVAAYVKAGAFSQKLGPADKFPGSVGFIRFVYDPVNSLAQIVALQSSVDHSRNEVGQILKDSGRNLAARYFKWKFQLIELALNFVEDFDLKKVSIGPCDENEKFPLSHKTRNHKLITEKACKRGFKLSEDGLSLIRC